MKVAPLVPNNDSVRPAGSLQQEAVGCGCEGL